LKISEILADIPRRKRDEAIWLLTFLCRLNRSDLILNPELALSAEQAISWKKAWRRRLQGEPLQYIVGSAPFWGRDFSVRRGVLIPRPETERLVEICLELLDDRKGARVLDIGTGSGAIAITLKLERPELEVKAVDISPTALKQSRENARTLGAEVEIFRGNLFSRAMRAECWDLVVSNPPYLDFRKDPITEEVSRWEPRLALEPTNPQRVKGATERAAWCAIRILEACAVNRPAFTALELSPRIASLLERQWRARKEVERVWRLADLAGRKRFLLVAWRHV
jgi:release factor glutamine methyltransferase